MNTPGSRHGFPKKAYGAAGQCPANSFVQFNLTPLLLNPAHDFYNFHSMDLDLPEEIYNQISPIISLDNFRRALHEYILHAGLPDDLVCVPQKWHDFLREYLRIIEDCPLRVRQDNAHFSIKEIIVQVSNDGLRLNPPKGEKYSFTVHWRFVGKNGIDGLVNNHLTIPMDPLYPSTKK